MSFKSALLSLHVSPSASWLQQKAFQMIIEGCVVGTIFAFAWRWSHMKEKARVHAYYKKLREEA
eukprot:CAMPEP_0113233030 /NCGR_PEP_ID=MMETSP0008_2-20120614/2264_1 /TAXON_ID=97485 /ORGANISM="Prymnesium parvum" /LENGTH=63 /DNA_ID=CAMNT_0000079781 /DNA_START=118 /DNA_END=309 /DNA_ORIENTATION=- /assembly_acc=CAM_ASM_000153